MSVLDLGFRRRTPEALLLRKTWTARFGTHGFNIDLYPPMVCPAHADHPRRFSGTTNSGPLAENIFTSRCCIFPTASTIENCIPHESGTISPLMHVDRTASSSYSHDQSSSSIALSVPCRDFVMVWSAIYVPVDPACLYQPAAASTGRPPLPLSRLRLFIGPCRSR